MPTNPLPDLRDALALLDKATPEDWMLATSCSWRRVLTVTGKPVLVPEVHSDGHPDLACGFDYANAEAAIAAVNTLRAHGPRILAALELAERVRVLLAEWEREDDWTPTFEEERILYRCMIGRADKLRALLHIDSEVG